MLWLALLGLALFPALRPAPAAAQPAPQIGSPARAQVYVAQDPQATLAFQPQPDRVLALMNQAITNLTGRPTAAEGWRSLVSTQDIVGLKVFSEPGPNSGTRQAVVAAVIEGLLSAGLKSNQIIVWDKHLIDLRLAGFFKLAESYGVRVAGSAEAGYDETTFYESPLIGNLVWGDLEFGKKGDGVGRKSFFSKLVSREMTKIINITPLMNHNQVGVAGALYSLALGSVENTTRFEGDPGRLANAVPEIFNQPALFDRVVLNICDALVCQYEGEERSLLHYSRPLNQLRLSRDPVALDVTSIFELDRQRQLAGAPPVKVNMALYSNAALLQLGISDLRKIQILNPP